MRTPQQAKQKPEELTNACSGLYYLVANSPAFLKCAGGCRSTAKQRLTHLKFKNFRTDVCPSTGLSTLGPCVKYCFSHYSSLDALLRRRPWRKLTTHPLLTCRLYRLTPKRPRAARQMHHVMLPPCLLRPCLLCKVHVSLRSVTSRVPFLLHADTQKWLHLFNA